MRRTLASATAMTTLYWTFWGLDAVGLVVIGILLIRARRWERRMRVTTVPASERLKRYRWEERCIAQGYVEWTRRAPRWGELVEIARPEWETGTHIDRVGPHHEEKDMTGMWWRPFAAQTVGHLPSRGYGNRSGNRETFQ